MSADQFDELANRFRETGLIPPKTEVPVPVPSALAGWVEHSLPFEPFAYPWQRERILGRAAEFEQQVQDLMAGADDPEGELASLYEAMLCLVDPQAPIELHGVASHFGPETLQAHVTDLQGNLRVWVRDGKGGWVERPDLAEKARNGEIPSAAPGEVNAKEQTATFAVATLDAAGEVDWSVPDLSRFAHTPIVKPYEVGDVVQFVEPTGEVEQTEKGNPFVPMERVWFGRLVGVDGAGNWTMALENADGSPVLDAQGNARQVTVTSAELRQMNNPTVLRNGDNTHDDIGFDPNHPAQQAMIADWKATEDYQALEASRPGPEATPDERAAWEREVIRATDAWLHSKMTYPTTSARERAPKTRDELLEQIAVIEAQQSGSSDPKLEARRLDLVKRLEQVEEEIAHYDRHSELKSSKRPNASNIGEYYLNGMGECRHQATAHQVLLQEMGLDSRMTSGAANTGEGNFRGLHLWMEVTLSDGSQVLVDPTWSSAPFEIVDLRTAYAEDPRRQERPSLTNTRYGGMLAWAPQGAGAA